MDCDLIWHADIVDTMDVMVGEYLDGIKKELV